MKAKKYIRLLGVQLRASFLLAMQYRGDFLIDGPISAFWAITAFTPLFVVFSDRQTVAGWDFPGALLVTGWFILLEGILEGAINPALTSVVDHIRKGTLDFVLLKPADAQFLVSTSRFSPWKGTNVLLALGLFGYAFHLAGRLPSVPSVLAALLLLASSTLFLYSLWILTVSAAFYVVRIDNLTYFFTSIFDAARWPADVFKGVIAFVFTFIIPLALMTTYPAEALLGRLGPGRLGLSLAGSALFAYIARQVWKLSIGKYTSASS